MQLPNNHDKCVDTPGFSASCSTAHTILRDLLRHQAGTCQEHSYTIPGWNHYLTMTRLVARALRMSKSTLIQTGVATHRLEGKYRLSYLIPVLLLDAPVTIALPVACHSNLVNLELPQLQQRLGTSRLVYTGNEPPDADFKGLWITDARSWLSQQFDDAKLGSIDTTIPTIIDGADDLEDVTRELLTITIAPEDWNSLRLSQSPTSWAIIGDAKIQLLETLWQRPENPYNCYLLESVDRQIIQSLIQQLPASLPPNWKKFQKELLEPENRIVWASVDRTHGTFTLNIAPNTISSILSPIWTDRSIVSIVSAVAIDADAAGYRQDLGIIEITSVKFSLDRQTDLFQLYIPRWMPMPNTPKFQPILVDEIQQLLQLIKRQPKFTVILVSDTPLQAQLAAILAAEWGSGVRVEQTNLNEANILISGWKFWTEHQDILPTPQLMIIATLPIPSTRSATITPLATFPLSLRKLLHPRHRIHFRIQRVKTR